MRNLTVNQIIQADFKVSEESPVLKPFDGSFIVADPSVLTPEGAHDNKWHMFFHTNQCLLLYLKNDVFSYKSWCISFYK